MTRVKEGNESRMLPKGLEKFCDDRKIIVEAAQITRCGDFGQIASPAGFHQEFSVAFSFR